jgi:hypothetical protein
MNLAADFIPKNRTDAIEHAAFCRVHLEPWDWPPHVFKRHRSVVQIERPKPQRCTLQTATAMLGLSARAVQALAARGDIPGAAKIGRRWTFDLDTLRRFIKNKESEVWQSARRPPDVTGAAPLYGVASRSVAGLSAGPLTLLIRQSRKRVAARARLVH